MNPKNRYVEQVLSQIHASTEHRERISQDLEAHFQEGATAGESEGEIIRRLGPPDEVAAAFMESVELRFAGFWIRTAAFLADMGVCLSVTLPLFCIVAVLGPSNEARPSLLFLLLAIPLVLWCIAVFLLYFPVSEGHFGKTLGKHLLGLRVLHQDGTRLPLGRAFLRRLSLYFDFLVLDALFVPFTEKKQRAFDLVAKTVVVREREELGVSNVLLCIALMLAPILLLLAVVAAVS